MKIEDCIYFQVRKTAKWNTDKKYTHSATCCLQHPNVENKKRYYVRDIESDKKELDESLKLELIHDIKVQICLDMDVEIPQVQWYGESVAD